MAEDSSEQGPSIPRWTTALHVVGLILLCYLLFGAFINQRALWDVDEGMHAVTSKVMVTTGDWVTPYFNGEKFYDKPPLYNWLAAVAFLLFGFTEWAARLPAVLLGTGTVLLTYWGGQQLFNARAGLLSAMILATSILFIVLSQVVVHDIALTFCVTGALLLFFRGYQAPAVRARCWYAGYICMGLGIVAKGPLGLLLPGMIVGAFLVFRRELALIKEMRLVRGLLIVLAIGLPWYVLMAMRNADFAEYFVGKQLLASFVAGGETRHPKPLYYYLPVLIGGLFPWSFLAPAALRRPQQPETTPANGSRLFLLLWAGLVFVFFSVAASKLRTYILPMFPAAALLIGYYMDRLISDPRRARRTALGGLGVLSVLLLSAVAFVYIAPPDRLTVKYGIDLAYLNMLVILMAAGGVTAFMLLKRHRSRGAFGVLAGMMLAAVIYVSAVLLPMMTPYRSTRHAAHLLDERLPPDESLVFFPRIRDSALFCVDRDGVVISGQPELAAYFNHADRRYCIMREKDFRRIPTPHGLHIIDRSGDRLVLSNQPDPVES